jgi:hypothetical protein
MKPTPYLGIITTAAPPALSAQLGLTEGFGLVVEEVLPDSPAKTSGLQRFDVLKQLNDQQLLDPMQLGTLVRSLGKDTEVTLTLLRKGQEQRLTIKIGEKEMPERRMEDIRSPFGSPSGSPFGGPEGRRGGEAGRGSGDQGREYQDRVRLMEEKLRDYQRSLNEWQEKVKKWHEKPEGEMPPRPPLPTVPSQESPRRPTGANEPGDGSFRTTRDQARVTLRDRDGEAELNTKDGQRTLTVRSSTGDVIFTGPVDTAEQRNAMPEDYRRKLQSLEAVPPPPPAGQRNQNRPAAPPPQQPDRQGEPKRSATPI